MNCPLCAFPERPHSLPLVSVRLPRLKVNMATVLAVSPLALSGLLVCGGAQPPIDTLTPRHRLSDFSQSHSVGTCCWPALDY